MAESKERQKAKSKGFAALGVPVGAVLTFRKDPNIKATVADDKNKVEYESKVYPISGLARKLMQCPVSGYHAFKYNGVLLAKLGNNAVSEAKPIADQPIPPPEDAKATSENAVHSEPQTFALPVAQDGEIPEQEGEDQGQAVSTEI